MKKIILVCSAGMSTSLLVSKMNAAAAKMGVEAFIKAVAEAEIENEINEADVMLLGPQVKFLLDKVRKRAGGRVTVDVVNSIDYGTMNGEAVLKHALSLCDS